MLENSLWQQYHTERTIRETLATLYGCAISQIADDERALYATLKRHLTKKEIRLFIMTEAGVDGQRIADTLKVKPEAYEKMRHKTYSKVRSNKIQDSVRFSHMSE